MRSPAALLLLFATLSACAQPTEQFADGGKCPALSDIATITPPCAAAKGLAGDSLICIDFSSVADQALTKPSPSELAGWDFEAPRIDCWQILNGRLQGCGSHTAQLSLFVDKGPTATDLRRGASERAIAWL